MHHICWPFPSASSGGRAHRGSLISDGKDEAGFLSPSVSREAPSAIHLPEATFPTKGQLLTRFVGEETAGDLNDLQYSRPLTTVRILVVHIG
jgi:hypothetical protein